MWDIAILNATQADHVIPDLAGLLQDAVDSGASVGFLPPLTEVDAWNYWQGVLPDLRRGSLLLWVARVDGRVVGTVQLALATKANATHRAEVQKLLVHRSVRRQGIARALMNAVEQTARDCGRSLLVLDTRQGDPSEQLYRRLGYMTAGAIPGYARSANGSLHTTVLFYKNLGIVSAE